MLAKVAAFALAIVEVLLLLRLLLPFVHWPAAIDQWVPKLIEVTNTLVAPFGVLIKAVDIQSEAGGVLSKYTNQLDAGVLVAMIGWAAIGFAALMLISVVNRAR